MDKQKILLVDDNKEIIYTLSKLLEFEGYEVEKAYDGMEALEIIKDNPIDLILLDVMMPRMNGLTAMMKIREHKKIPIIILSAKTEESDKVSGLIMGADDYITKPFNTAELMARVQAQLRRYLVWNEGRPQNTENKIINGDLVLDISSKTVIVNGTEVRLTAKEYHIMELLIRNVGRVFSAEEIYEKVWDDKNCFAVENTVMVHIRRIREKIEVNTKNPRYLKVVWGIGYKIEKIKN
ncbi:response regulator transcription factor [Anaerocolumna aminovalerica]|jgi:DNA-binding response OmpR family regulator|uniref:Stage 0 sporulation protein A homolog n=1 Tax=Anaerocolumna aminovalerica TaxID=1527 RepID=A0A1I5IBY6_9FIRM|nr:response regulator transcription factor [Anaerocolumna aminovalerica]MBU5334053.1 response regulator transcription factor [Anaerocolumna aminovalerica]MDU6266169.1 response regulator transcription factor [Anaerocolumna aminovalerica]SFO58014.1 DNA-binding response regulator, OmpR family, contains REC and winged-helix (wHTH) domain [Anaerocolumna aminovalerica]